MLAEADDYAGDRINAGGSECSGDPPCPCHELGVTTPSASRRGGPRTITTPNRVARLRQSLRDSRRMERKDPVVSRNLEPVQLSELLHQVPGKWVAIRDGEIVEASDTLDQLIHALHYRNLSDATLMRAPAEAEAEMVGLG